MGLALLGAAAGLLVLAATLERPDPTRRPHGWGDARRPWTSRLKALALRRAPKAWN